MKHRHALVAVSDAVVDEFRARLVERNPDLAPVDVGPALPSAPQSSSPCPSTGALSCAGGGVDGHARPSGPSTVAQVAPSPTRTNDDGGSSSPRRGESVLNPARQHFILAAIGKALLVAAIFTATLSALVAALGE